MNKDIRDAFFEQVYNIAKEDKNVIFISADADAFSLKKFKKELPDQFINVGVAEQNMVLLATGLALANKKVFIYSITPFITLRCLEHIKVNICSMNLDVTIIGTGCGFSFSYDGPTHHATQDLAIMRTLPELVILNPCDEVTAQESAKIAYNSKKPVFVRIDKGVFNKIYKTEECEMGIKEISSISKIKIISTGSITHRAINISKKIFENKNVKIDVIDLYKIKPIEEKIIDILKNSQIVFTLEENTKIGGIGSIVGEIILDNELDVKLKRLSLRDKQELEFGDREWLLEINDLSEEKIYDTIINKLNIK